MQCQLYPNSVGHEEPSSKTTDESNFPMLDEKEEGSEMKIDWNHRNTFEVREDTFPFLLLSIVLFTLALFLTGCNYPGNSKSATPTVQGSADENASVSGKVWREECMNDRIDSEPDSGCILDPSLDQTIGNGIYDSGEQGLAEIDVAVGAGACPGTIFRTVKTDASGEFYMDGLKPGVYCIMPNLGGLGFPASLQPGFWTYPQNGMQTLVLLSGEIRTDINFAWDPADSMPIPTETPVPTSIPHAGCVDSAVFIKDVTVLDGAVMEPEESFTKTWRIRNVGSCNWTDRYALVFSSGASMESSNVIPLKTIVKQGQLLDLSVRLSAPEKSGTYWGYWMIRNDEGEYFGVGEYGNSPLWVKILVEPEISDWRGEYFNNKDLKGDPDRIRNDEEVDFNWKGKSPASNISENGFSARWTRQLRFDDGVYQFSLRVDDGIRLWVDNRLVLDKWENGSVRTHSVYLDMNKGKHDVKIEYYENYGDAIIQLDIDKKSPSSEGRWLSKIWFNHSLDSDWALVDTSDNISFDWGTKSPSFMIPKDNFSGRWSRTVSFEPGRYRFYARADDGIRVKINNLLILDEWHSSDGSITYSIDMDLSGSQNIEVSYYEHSGHAKIMFWWELIGTQNQAPTATMDDFETIESSTLIIPAPGVLQNDSDPEGSSLTAILVSGPASGRVELNEDGSFSYIPDEGFVGHDEFTYYVSDGELISDVVPALLTVQEANHRPVAQDDRFSFTVGEPLEIPAPGVLENDFDADSEGLVVQLETDPSAGELTLYEDGSFRYIPDSGSTDQVQFSYRVSDGKDISNYAVVTITLSDRLPIAEDDLYDIETGSTLQIVSPGVMGNDKYLSGEVPLAELVDGPDSGELKFNRDGSFEYTPEMEFTGEVQFTYLLRQEGTISEIAVVRILVRPLNSVSNPPEEFS